MRRVGLVEACDDSQLFGFPLWPRQRELLRAVERERLHVWALGRRSGKTTLAALVCLWSCLLRPELTERLRPGERGYSVAVATNIRQARVLVQAARSIVERSPLLAGMVESSTEDEIVFRSGMALAAFPASSRAGRGYPIATLVLDEAAFFVDTDGNAAAEPVWQALAPATAQFGADARLVVSSTPWGSDGLFATLYQQAVSGELEDAVAQHAASAEVNPTLDRGFLEAERRRDPEAFESEYEARFLRGGTAFFDPENVQAAVTLPGELRPVDGVLWVAGLDPGFAQDPFAVVLVGRDPVSRRRLLVGVARSWLPPRRKTGSLEEARDVEDSVLAGVAELCRLFGARAVTDQYKAAGVVERLRRYGVAVRAEPMTAPSKDAAFGFLRGRINEGSLELYEHGELLRELRAVRTRYAAGRSSVVLPRIGRGHCDHAQALAIACLELDRGGMGGPVTDWRQAEQPGITVEVGLDSAAGEMRSAPRTPRWYDGSGGILDEVF